MIKLSDTQLDIICLAIAYLGVLGYVAYLIFFIDFGTMGGILGNQEYHITLSCIKNRGTELSWLCPLK
jgi:hypothetical protein